MFSVNPLKINIISSMNFIYHDFWEIIWFCHFMPQNKQRIVISVILSLIVLLIDIPVLNPSHSSSAYRHGLWLPCSLLWAGMWLMLNQCSLPLCGQHPSICPPVRQRDWGRNGFFLSFFFFFFFSRTDEAGWKNDCSDLCCVITVETGLLLYTCRLNTKISLPDYVCSVWVDWELATVNKIFYYLS